MEYKTKDFYLSALLLSEGYKLINSEKHKGNVVYFIFDCDNQEKLQNILSDFINMTATTNVKKFVVSINQIRNELSKHKDIMEV
jgi:uncharacterized protein (UPF0332 family)